MPHRFQLRYAAFTVEVIISAMLNFVQHSFLIALAGKASVKHIDFRSVRISADKALYFVGQGIENNSISQCHHVLSFSCVEPFQQRT